MPIIVCRDADASANPVNFYQQFLPTFDGALYALYLLGESFPLDVLKDYSGNGRDLNRVGAPVVNPMSVSVGSADYYQTPFTPAALAAATTTVGGVTKGAGELSIMGVCTVPTNQGFALASTLSSSAAHVSLAVGVSPAVDQSVAMIGWDGAGVQRIASVANNSHRGTAPEFLAGSIKLNEAKAYRRYEGQTLQSGVNVAAAAPSGASAFRIGAQQTAGGNYVAATKAPVSLVAFYSRVITATEMDQAYVGIRDWFAERSSTFWTTP